jgi:hypothetical protein
MRKLVIAVVALLLLVGAAIVFRTAMPRSEAAEVAQLAPPPAAGAKPKPAVSARITRIEGVVERRSGAQEYRPIAAGDTLLAEDSLRTRGGGSAELEIGRGAQVEVAERSEFRIGELSEGLSQVRLEGGRIHARVQGGGSSTLRVEVKDSDAVVETQAGEFAMLRSGDAQVTVATNEGEVDVTAKQQRVRLAKGEQSVVVAGQAPSLPSRIPPSLFLKISRTPRQLSKPTARIGGETTPGAIVEVNGKPVRVEADGRFSADVRLIEGRNELVVSAQDAAGRTESQRLAPVTVDTTAPEIKGRVVW